VERKTRKLSDKDFGESNLLIYGIGIILSMLALITGLLLTNKKKEGKKWLQNNYLI